MILLDYHTHSEFSFDGSGTFSDLLRAAERAGISELAITDHCDFSVGGAGLPANYDAAAILRAFRETADRNPTSVALKLGVEAGQPTHAPGAMEALLAAAPYDVVLGSLHNLRGDEDFYFKQYRDKKSVLTLLGLYFSELLDLCESCDFDVLAHLTYPLRYIGDIARELPLSDYRDAVDAVLQTVIRRGIALEVNTGGFFAPWGPLPGAGILRRYRELGGELVTVGSDGHGPGRVGTGVREGRDLLIELGFRGVYGFTRRTPEFHPFS